MVDPETVYVRNGAGVPPQLQSDIVNLSKYSDRLCFQEIKTPRETYNLHSHRLGRLDKQQ